LKILYFHQHFSTPSGSAGTRSYEMARRLIADGHEVTMVCGSYANGKTGLTESFRGGKRSGNVDGIRVIEFDLSSGNKDGFLKRSFTFARYAARSIGSALREPADVVFATSTPLTAGIPGIAAKWLRRKPFVFEVRDLWPELPKAMGVITNPLAIGAMSLLEWASYKSADRLIGLSPGIVDGIKRRGISGDIIALAPNGCDLELFGSDVAPWRPKEVADDDFMAIFTGTHGAANGLNAVIDAAAELKRRKAQKIKLLLVGDGKEKSALMQRVADEALSGYVIFADPVPKTQLVGLMKSADLGLQILANVPAFYYGTSPNKFFDYISASLPVLTNYPGWVADLVVKHDCGVAIKQGDAESFADALSAMAQQTDAAILAQKANALALAKQEFSRDALYSGFAKQLMAAYHPSQEKDAA
jgi:glycosyltransferase involved in cell wall biosynthesis